MPYDQLGKLLLAAGAALLLAGLLFLALSKTGFGGLPGDINFRNGNFTCVAPIVSMLLLSLILTVLLNLVMRLFNK